MPFCPICKYEYREGFTVCADCDESLVDALVIPVIENERIPDDTPDVSVLLCSFDCDTEADVAVSILWRNDIPVIKKQRGPGEDTGVYTGMPFRGSDVYVPSMFLATAHELLSETPASDE